MVGQKGDLKATDPVMADAKKLNKAGGVSLGSGGTGYLAAKGDKLVTVQAKGIGADDGIIGKAARKLGLTKDKDKALEAQRQNTSRANRERYLQGQELTDKNITGYQTKGAVRKGEKTGLNIKDSYEYDTFDTVLEYLIAEGYADSNESALVIMANMSEEWREEILDEAYQKQKFGRKDYSKKLSKRGGMGMGTPEDPHGYRDPKMAKVGAEFSKRKTAEMKAKKTGQPDSYRAEKESQSKNR